jgi:hypothetical protein
MTRAGANSSSSRSTRRLFLLLVCATLFILCSSQPLRAQQDERSVRAAFVYNLTKYVSFPQARDEIVIGFVGKSTMGSTLAHLIDGKTSDNRRIRVLLHPNSSELEHCDLLYVDSGSQAQDRPIIEKAQSLGILTVGEEESFTRKGGIVGLVRAGDQIQIEINLEAARAARIQISARLLDLAVIVRTARQG